MTQLASCLLRLSQLQSQPIDRLALTQTLQDIQSQKLPPAGLINALLKLLQMPQPVWLVEVRPEHAPLLLWHEEQGWAILRGANASGQWVIESIDPLNGKLQEKAIENFEGYLIAKIKLVPSYKVSKSPVFQQISTEFFSHKRTLIEAVLGGIMINVIVLATSLYSMQVYDRVVPTGAEQTLWVLTLGVIGANVFELVAKFARSALYERVIDGVDQKLARSVFIKFLTIRLDQMPRSVGGMASQLRGYETVRSFMYSLTNQLLVDTPFAILFAFIMAMMAGWLAIIPVVFLLVSLTIGIYSKKKIERLTASTTAATNLKTGLLVEAIEGAETIKSGQGGWRMLARWVSTIDEARGHESKMRHATEHSQYIMGLLQQLSYVVLVATGALLVSTGHLTMGSLIACSILSGRILTPMGAIPAQLVQWGHTKAALQGLDKVWALEDDHGNKSPIQLLNIKGDYSLENIEFRYTSNPALNISNFRIVSGEKIGILGPIGAGKTSMLRLLSGMYKPQSGRVLLDDIDISQIFKPKLAEKIGYLQQDGRLFAGTLRENLTLGMLDPGDEAILHATKQTGLFSSVISVHPKGLSQEIFEGGTGLSGGQRQLVNLTRIFLRNPSIWLLDEPTASMDRSLEMHIMSMFSQTLKPTDTFIVVTHKAEILELVNRVVVIANHRIVLDGPKADVLAQLQRPTATTQPSTNNGFAV